MREFFEVGFDLFVGLFIATIAVLAGLATVIVVGGYALYFLGVDISPDAPYYKTQIERCRERGNAILDASGYLKECRLRSFD